MSPDFGDCARTLLAGEEATASELADRAVHACERLTTHLARLLGDAGVQVMLRRTVMLAAKQFPWLAAGASTDPLLPALRDAMERQDRDSIIEGFVSLLTAFVGLLERLIGEGLVARLLEEVWPSVFTHAEKDTP